MTQRNGGSIWVGGTSKISSKISHELGRPPAALAPWFVSCPAGHKPVQFPVCFPSLFSPLLHKTAGVFYEFKSFSLFGVLR